ncbi:3-hydroxybutyryl-CoA dehydrogenase (EC; 3-hydroxyacyl-CoA dehydrogenase (EC [Olavius algarvensis associated proteobacterium Delta 3]|nr:3-hydroxybutyryl-CoA dehydrogenase (EC; 3-hydroxyacyl-CoA dehydrogenase (EC [Olavius algarvensis associated proteobacterium Delta 3]
MSQIKKIGVIGAGNMGSGIAQKIAQEGIDVVMVDVTEEFVQRGLKIIEGLLQEGIERKIFTPEQAEQTLSRIHATADMNAVADADLVIEAVFEDKQVKSDLFKRLDDVCSEKTILATNTSSFFVRDFAEKTTRPDRFIGLHYFYHPAKNRLLEVIPCDDTSPETIEKSLLAAKLHSKTSILVKDAPGFAVNRFFVPFLNEAARLLEEQVADIPTIEEAAKRAFRIGMGPFQLMNVTGIPIAVHAATTLGDELGPFYAPADILKAQKDSGENWNLEGPVDETKIPEVQDRLYGVCLGVAGALVNEGVASMEDTDRGAKIGLRWALGPFELMNKIGIDRTLEVVEQIASRYPDFEVPEVLIKQQASGQPFQFSLVDLDVKDDIATITLNRPEAMNALNETVVAQLGEQFEKAEADPQVRAVVFQGAGKAFVAGADIRYFVKNIKADRIPDIVAFTRKGHEVLMRIENSEKRTIALLDGLSLGGGSELALACQAIVATPAGSMAFPETGIGIYPGLGGMLRLARQVGPALAKYYVFTGAPISAKDGAALGLVTELVSPPEVESAVRKLVDGGRPDKFRTREIPDKFQELAAIGSDANVARLLSGELPEGVPDAVAAKSLKIIGYKAPLALRIANDIIDAQVETSMPDAVEIELNRLAEIFSTEDALEGLSSLGRKRPEYKSR